MRTRNLLFVALLFVSTLSLKANNTEPTGKNQELIAELGNLLKQANLTSEMAQSITINFLVNANREVVVISTSNTSTAESIKNTLNYKTIKTSDYEVNKIYTLPVKIVKK
jgi:phosphoserine phosphatase